MGVEGEFATGDLRQQCNVCEPPAQASEPRGAAHRPLCEVQAHEAERNPSPKTTVPASSAGTVSAIHLEGGVRRLEVRPYFFFAAFFLAFFFAFAMLALQLSG